MRYRAPRHGSEVPAHGEVQHQGGVRPHRECGGFRVWHAHLPVREGKYL